MSIFAMPFRAGLRVRVGMCVCVVRMRGCVGVRAQHAVIASCH